MPLVSAGISDFQCELLPSAPVARSAHAAIAAAVPPLLMHQPPPFRTSRNFLLSSPLPSRQYCRKRTQQQPLGIRKGGKGCRAPTRDPSAGVHLPRAPCLRKGEARCEVSWGDQRSAHVSRRRAVQAHRALRLGRAVQEREVERAALGFDRRTMRKTREDAVTGVGDQRVSAVHPAGRLGGARLVCTGHALREGGRACGARWRVSTRILGHVPCGTRGGTRKGEYWPAWPWRHLAT